MGEERRSGNAGGGVGISGFLFAGSVGDAVAVSLAARGYARLGRGF